MISLLALRQKKVRQEDIMQCTNEFKTKLEKAYKMAAEKAGENSSRQKGHYDRKIRGAAVQVGDGVLVRNVGL